MHFRAIDEQPFTAPPAGAPRLLLGFAALSLLLHGLLLITRDEAAPLTVQQLGSPYIRAVLSTQPAPDSHNEQPANTDNTDKRPAATEPRAQRDHTAAPRQTDTPDRQSATHHINKAIAPSAAGTKIHEPSNTTDSYSETVHDTPPPSSGNEPADSAQQAPVASKQHARGSTANSPQTNTAAQRNYLLGQLQDQLSRYLSYPLRARRRGWEGEVLLGLRLDGEGRLHDIRLLRSSGYALLDRSALKALSRIERLQLPASTPSLQPTHLQLPVIYRLSES